jgi:uncharacterized membrane protein YdbT with pleckstrin-like domain
MQTYRPTVRWWSLVNMRLIAHFTEKLEITEDCLILTNGLLGKSEKVVPFSRITNYSTQQNIFDRMVGISNFSIETAGSPLPEVVLTGYPHALSAALSSALGNMP